MKRLIFMIIILLGIGIQSQAKLIEEGKYFRYQLNSLSGDGPEYVACFFGESEVIDGKEYQYVYGQFSQHPTFPVGTYRRINMICISYFSTEDIDIPLLWKKLFLMREDNGKVYFYNDRDHLYTQPTLEKCLHLDLRLQPEGCPDEFLINDFTKQPGESFETWIIGRDGTLRETPFYVYPCENDAAKSKMLNGGFREESDGMIIHYDEDYGFYDWGIVGGLIGEIGYEPHLVEIGNIKDSEGRDYTSEPNREYPIYENRFEYFSQSKADSRIRYFDYYHIIKDSQDERWASLCKTYGYHVHYEKRPEGQIGTDEVWATVYPNEEIARFRKEDGRIYVVPKPEWVDSETGNAFSEGTELLYADMNVDRGDTFRSFTMRDNVVTPFERKVYGIVTTLWPNDDNYEVVLFCKENGKLDGTICYIDGFGFYGTREEHSGDFKSHVHRFYNSKSEKNYTVWYGQFDGMGSTYEVPDEVKAGVVMPTVKNEHREGIYTIEGLRLNVSRDELPAGFYIINGKKTFVN